MSVYLCFDVCLSVVGCLSVFGCLSVCVCFCAFLSVRGMSYLRCWFSNLTYFYASLIAPLGVMLVFNLVTVLVVTKSLHSKLSLAAHYSKLKLLRIIGSLSLLVGITWIVGALLSFVDSLVLQYAFAILNSLQGFLIFYVNILTSSEIRTRIGDSMKSAIPESMQSNAAGDFSSHSNTNNEGNSRSTFFSRQHGYNFTAVTTVPTDSLDVAMQSITPVNANDCFYGTQQDAEAMVCASTTPSSTITSFS